ncbi:MAG: cytochrome c [Candidatus Binatia bacterium]
MSRSRKILAAVILIALAGGAVRFYLFREVGTYYKSEEDNFKYGSVGVEAASGLPYWIWRALPRVCPEKLGPDGYTSFGFVWERGEDAPVGFPTKTVGFRRIGINCALCHTSAIRTSEASEPQIFLGAPSTTVDVQRYLRFLGDCGSDPRFAPEKILREVKALYDLPLIEGLLYRYLVIPQMKKGLLKLKAQLAWMDALPEWGPGRQDPFNPAKMQILKFPPDGTIGNADILPLWNWRRREGFALHWDGLNTSLTEIFLNSGIGNGASDKTIDIKNLDRVKELIQNLPPAKYPFTVDSQLAAKGAAVFARHCAECHAFGGEMTGKPVPIERVNTDRRRLDSWSQATADGFNGLDEYRWKYVGFRGTFGYIAVPLDGVWARAPYLHNGSVPSIRDLLEPPEKRPKVFYRGYNVYDPENLGFVSQGREAEKAGFKFDTHLDGNGNAGHLWGTQLSSEEKRSLIEYLKTL